MQFYEKLIFMLNLTQSTNRMLAQELQVDPSLISRLKTGTRGIPHNRDHMKAMASYFARRCTTEYQRQALSEMLGIKLALTMKKEQLSEILYQGLCGESDEVGRFMRTFETLNVGEMDNSQTIVSCDLKTNHMAYYGKEGKRAAARAVYQHLLSLKNPCTIFLFSDEADDWISEDYEFHSSLQGWGLTLLQLGFSFRQIAPPAASVDLAFESLIRWTPLYMTGRVDAYYYPRIRDNVHRRTLVVVPGVLAMTSDSVAGQQECSAAILTTDIRLTQAYSMQFQNYLSLCRPMQTIYKEPEKLMQCFIKFFSLNGGRIQMAATLSADTAPPELMACCMDKFQNPDWKKLGHLFLQEPGHMMEGPDHSAFIDIAYLASAKEVRSGSVPIILSYWDKYLTLYYTPELYILHLKNILHIMEVCETYHFIPVNTKLQENGVLLVKDVQQALLVRTVPPLTVFEISQPDIVQLFREHLLKIANRIGYTGVSRSKIMSQIRERIRELQA